MPGSQKKKEIVAAVVTADAKQFDAAFKRATRGIDDFARNTGRRLRQTERELQRFARFSARAAAEHQAVWRKAHSANEVAMNRELRQFVALNAAQRPRAQGFGQKALVSQRMNMQYGRLNAARRSNLRGGLSRAGGLGRGIAAGAGIYGFGQMLEQGRSFEGRLTDVAVNAQQMSTEWMDKARSKILAVSNAYGKAREDVLEYVAAVVEQTGSSKLALGTTDAMGKVALATGANFKDLAGLVVSLNTKLGMTKDQFMGMMDVFASQADKGSFELRNLATDFTRVLNLAGRFDMKGERGGRVMGAIMQVARRGNTSSAEAATSAERMLTFISSRRKAIERTFGVTLKQNGKWKDLAVILKDIAEAYVKIEKSGKKVADLSGKKKVDVDTMMEPLFGRLGQRTMLQFVQQARAGWTNKIGDWETFSNLVNVKKGVLAKKVDFRKNTPAYQWDQAVQMMRNSIHEHLLPVIVELSKKMPDIAKVVKFLLDNSDKLAKLWLGYKGAQIYKMMAPKAREWYRGENIAMGGPGGGGMGYGMMGGGGAPGTMPGALSRGGIEFAPGSDAWLLEMERRRKLGYRARSWGRRAAGAAVPMVGQALGAAGMFWSPGNNQTGNMIANTAMMTGNKYAMAGGIGWHLGAGLAKYTRKVERVGDALDLAIMQIERASLKQDVKQLNMENATMGVDSWFHNTQAGAIASREGKKLLDSMLDVDQLGFVFKSGKWGAGQKGKKGLEQNYSKLSGIYGQIKSQAALQLRQAGQEVTAENLAKVAPVLTVMEPVLKEIQRLLARIESGEGFNVTAEVHLDDPNRPGSLADLANIVPWIS